MPTVLLGLLALVIVLWALHAIARANPGNLVRVMKPTGGLAAVGAAVFLGMRGQLAIALPLGFFGLSLLGVPAFLFQEGHDPVAERAFREMARLSRGAYCRFDPGAAQQLRELLRAVAAYAAGGLKALTALSQHQERAATKLLEQLR